MAGIGMPTLDIVFKGLGVSAIQRGARGVAVLVLKDETDTTFDTVIYRSLADLTSAELAKFTATNQQYIKDVLEGLPLKVIVARMDEDGVLADLLAIVKGVMPRNCWIGIAEGTTAEHNALATFVKTENLNNKKCYKAMVYQATAPDSMAVVNFSNDNVTFADTRGVQAGDKAIATLLGFFAGLPLTMSGIGKFLNYKFSSVVEPASLETAINAGKLVLYSEDGNVKVARAVNSLTTTGQEVTDDMKFILIVEQMHLIYTDIYDTWNNDFKGKFKNYMDNQLLLIGAINSYFEGLENDSILDPNYDNVSAIDLEAQRLANVPKYGAETVNGWDDKKAMTMTFGTNVFLIANIKILNAMEDIKFNIYM